MLPLERHRLIVELLGQHGVMRVNEIAQATRVSRETIRRDLSELERKGILTRSHGGALAAENPLPATRAAASALPVEDSQGSLLKQMLLAARQTVALVDGSKLGRTGVARIGGLGELDCLVTERFVDPLLEKEMTWHNVSLQIA
ncbi:TPA: DeoR/GlpR transcriptional regulator [Klebsiella pneumoniae]|nr:DeoR/GlpR transcriptional regulator [Klebsiella pneumoniae]HBS4692635.1 DeoR/GlpR transcriptional regulator [Klebsiella pneumoniae]HCM3112649.1 DeoR/GlpR transcriptional regulator [Klebsiella pneumoniae]HCM3116062.1 DeoR/GlpR transcriptional regulator [Klebsiella pneumoniae]HCM5578468.1 DeoR/GlpR transcriptional regulator [Klebsiella pneumoniae]